MTENEARKLQLRDRVMWRGDKRDQGTVVDKGYAAVTIAWDNGQTGQMRYTEMIEIGRVR